MIGLLLSVTAIAAYDAVINHDRNQKFKSMNVKGE